MKPIFRAASLLFLLTTLVTPKAFAQQPLPHFVLFETFTNACQPSGSAADADRNAFDQAVTQTVSSEQTKILHLDYHFGNECDYLENAYCGLAAAYVNPPGNEVFWAAVDRSIFNSTSTRASGTQSDWSDAIDAAYPPSSPDNITLLSATLDQSNPQLYILNANVQVALTTSVSDSLIIRYAVLQDNTHDTLNSGQSSTLNDVVRYISTSNTGSFVVFPGGGSSGQQKNVTFQVSLPGVTARELVPYNWSNMRLIAFIEDVSQGNFQVVDAVQLKAGLDTLKSPPPTLLFNENYISDSTLYPGEDAQVFFSSTNLPLGVTSYFSTNNGTNWIFIADSQHSPFTWIVPDTLTTEGKFKLVGQSNPNLVSIEQGTFMIAKQNSVSFIQPAANIVIPADTPYTVEWTKYGVGKVTLQYSIANTAGTFPVFKPIITNTLDTSFVWTPPDTSAVIELQLVPDSSEAPAYSVVDTLEKRNVVNSVTENPTISGLAITNIYPNPASNGQEVVVAYSDASGKPVTLELLDLLGRQLPSFYTVDQQDIRVNTTALETGVYVVRLNDGVNTVSKRVEILQ